MESEKTPASNGLETPRDSSSSGLYEHSLWSQALANERRALLSTLFLPMLYTALLMWACLSLFWGSLMTNNDLGRIRAAVINLEGSNGIIGARLVDATLNTTASLDWRLEENAGIGTARDLVLNEVVWAALEVSGNATMDLQQSIASGNAAYNPTNAVTLYYASARNQITVNSHVVPGALAIVNPALAASAAEIVDSFLRKSVNDTTALQTALRCPQCFNSPLLLKQVDLVPFDAPVASGSTMVGMIFLLTFSFSIFQILRVNALSIGSKLRLPSALLFRTVASLAAYCFFGLMYTLINRAFSVPMDGTFNKSAGFVVYWMLNWWTMAAVGLPMESLFTLIGLQWAAYFLSFWIIVNVSGGFGSFNIEPRFYQYGYAMPFYHSIQGARTIIFGTRNHLGVNFGVLIAWSVVSLAGVYIFTARRVRENRRRGLHIVP